MIAVLTLTIQFLTVDTDIDPKGRVKTQERLTYTTSSIPYESMGACNNAKNEWVLAVGAYQKSTRPAHIVMAVCNNTQSGSIE
jgi:hypothetical protein